MARSNDTTERFFATRAAREVPCAPRTLTNYANRGLVPHSMIDGVHVFTRESIDAARALHKKHRRRG